MITLLHKWKSGCRWPRLMWLAGVVICLWALCPGCLHAMEADFRGQLSGWTVEMKHEDEWINNTGVRFIPALDLNQPLKEGRSIDAEFSLNGYAAKDSRDSNLTTDLDVYRATLRLATIQTETRIGLQNISFGPAQLLRPLRWFDALDPTDPQQLTTGVRALRFTVNTMNNASLWAWCLYGNDDPKGYEILPTASGSPEFGGRFQYPVLDGELAATVHYREVDGSSLSISEYSENRFALDGRWDIGVGLWFEASFQHQDAALLPYEWIKMATIGLDYTFGIGSGLYLLCEHMGTAASADVTGWDEEMHVSAFLLNYPLGFMDNLSAIGYYTWDQQKYGQYLNWQRTYDMLVFSLGAFYYPEFRATNMVANQLASYGGYGGEIMVIFNY